MPDGTIDTSMYPKAEPMNLLQNYALGQSIANARQQNQLLQTNNARESIALSQDKIDQVHKNFQYMGSYITALASDPATAGPNGKALVVNGINHMVDQGMLLPDVAAKEISQVPEDPTQRMTYLRTQGARLLDGQQQFAAIHGTPSVVDDGNSLRVVNVSPITGVTEMPNGILQKKTSPSDRMQPVNTTEVVNGKSYPAVKPMGQVMQDANFNPMTGLPNVQSGAQPSGQRSAITGPAIGDTDAQQIAGKASAERYSSDTSAQTTFQQNVLPMQQAYQGIKELGKTGVGPGAEQLNQIKSFAISMGIPLDPNSVTTTDEVNKYLSQMARQNGFTGSDAQLNAAQQASPTMKTSAGASLGVLRKMIAMQRLGHAQVAAFDATGQNPSQYSKWAADWNSKQNAAAYTLDLMDPTDRAAYIKTLNTQQKSQFVSSLRNAVKLGYVEAPSAQGAQ